MSKHILRWSMKCRLGGDIEYNPAEPETFTKALQEVQAKKAALEELGAVVPVYSATPVKVKE